MSNSLLIRNIPREVKTELRVRAARNGRSMEEARLILAAALVPPAEAPRMASDGLPWSLGEATRMIFGPENGVELELPPREPMREPPDSGWVLDKPEPDEDEPEPPKPGP